MVNFNELSTTDKINFMGQVMVLLGTACIAYSNIMKAVHALPGSAMFGVSTGDGRGTPAQQQSTSGYFF